MDLKKNFSEDTKKLIESVVTQMTIDRAKTFGKATSTIACYFIQLEKDARQKRGEKVWAGQIVFTGEELPIIRINEEVKGKVEVGYQWQRISQKLIRDFRRLSYPVLPNSRNAAPTSFGRLLIGDLLKCGEI